jgi:hypothetical protein
MFSIGSKDLTAAMTGSRSISFIKMAECDTPFLIVLFNGQADLCVHLFAHRRCHFESTTNQKRAGKPSPLGLG